MLPKSLISPALLPGLLPSLLTGLLVSAPPASADSTADLLLSLECQDHYRIEVWQSRSADVLLYRAHGPLGSLSLNEGTRQATEGVQVYKFQNGGYAYWVWDGTLDSQQAGTLEVYENDRLLMRKDCRKV
ncbi:MAG: hypothetical protein ACKO7W_08760 [Elainella sp.]